MHKGGGRWVGSNKLVELKKKEKKKKDDWPRVNRDPEGLSYITDLPYHQIALLLTQDACTPFRSVSLPSFRVG